MQKLIDLIRDHRRRHASHSGDDWTDHDLAKAMANVVAAAGAGNAAALGVVKVLMEKCPGFAAVVERVAGAEEPSAIAGRAWVRHLPKTTTIGRETKL